MINSVGGNYVQQNVAFKSNDKKLSYEKTNKGKIIGASLGLGAGAAQVAFAKRPSSLLKHISNKALAVNALFMTLIGLGIGVLFDKFSNMKKIAEAKAQS